MEIPPIKLKKQEHAAYLSSTVDVNVGTATSKSNSTAERLDVGENDSTQSFPTNIST